MPKKSKKYRKKHRKHKKKYVSSSSSSSSISESSTSSSSDSESAGEFEWVEKKSDTSKVVRQRDDWMMGDSFVPSYALQEKKREKKQPEKDASVIEKMGQSSRELNPYWKNGGTGLPPEKPESYREKHTELADYDDYFRSKTSKGFVKPEEDKRDYNIFGGNSSKGRTSRWRKTTAETKTSAPQVERKRESSPPRRRKESSPRRKTSPLRREASPPRRKESPPRRKSSPPQRAQNEVLTEAEMNSLASKILKAEIMGNANLANELKQKLEKARKARESHNDDNVVLLTNVNARGFTQPVRNLPSESTSRGRDKRKKTYETHADGKRVRYFEDDEKYTLTEMFEREQMKSAADHNLEFAQLSAKSKGDRDHDVDDLFMEQSMYNKKKKDKDRDHAVEKQKRTEKALDNCTWCLTNNKLKKHLIISTKSKCYLCVPYFQSLTEGHCMIVPSYHSTCITLLDEDVWDEILEYCKILVKMFRKLDQDVVFFETAMYFRHYPHMILHCIPIPYESGNLAPIYFKKAILECEKEWANNKKLVEFKKMDVKRVIPKGLPYFMVNFGMDSGFAHVIEDEQYFPKNFAQEIIGGMLDLDHRVWRKQQPEEFEAQCKKVNTFKEMWKKVDGGSSRE